MDYAIEALQKGEPVDLTAVVAELRQDRMALIQHDSQYKFAYQGVVQYAHMHRQARDEAAAAAPIYALASTDDSIKQHTLSRDWRLYSEAEGVMVFELMPGLGLKQDINEPAVEEEAEEEEEEEEEMVGGHRVGEGAPAIVTPQQSLREGSEQEGTAAMHKLQPQPQAGEDRRVSSRRRSSSSDRPRQMKDEPWFKSNFTRAQVDEALGDAPSGTFLVRPSSKPHHYALSIRQEKRISNLLIVPVQDGAETLYKLGNTGKHLYDVARHGVGMPSPTTHPLQGPPVHPLQGPPFLSIPSRALPSSRSSVDSCCILSC